MLSLFLPSAELTASAPWQTLSQRPARTLTPSIHSTASARRNSDAETLHHMRSRVNLPFTTASASTTSASPSVSRGASDFRKGNHPKSLLVRATGRMFCQPWRIWGRLRAALPDPASQPVHHWLPLSGELGRRYVLTPQTS